MTDQLSKVRAAARRYRAANPERQGGVVLVFEGKAYGWKNELRDPAHERPGAYAVDKAGLVFKTKGGDDYNGANEWVAVDPDE